MSVNEQQISLKAGGNFPTAFDYWNQRTGKKLPFNETAKVVVTSNVALINNTLTIPSTLSLDLASVEQGGLISVALLGAVGIPSLNRNVDGLGQIINKVTVRDATTHDAILEPGGKEIFGLIQCVSTANDGDSIGAIGSENIQISFVYISATGVLTLSSINNTIEFTQNVLYLRRNLPTYLMDGGSVVADAVEGATFGWNDRKFTVTTPFIPSEIINITTGAGAGSGTCTIDSDSDSVVLNTLAADFYADGGITINYNGISQHKGATKVCRWDSTNSFHFTYPLYVGDEFTIKQFYKL